MHTKIIAATVAAAAMSLLVSGSASGQTTAGDSAAAIVVTEQASDQILVLDSDESAWSTAEIAWRWRPTAANGFADLLDNWGLPDEAKLRHRGDQAYLLTTDSYGLAAVVPYPQGTGAYWAADVGRAANPHSIELLPNGNVAVVASTGGWLRVYTASQDPRSTTYVQFDLPDAHGVYWDDARQLLWALGGHDLVALRVTGRPATPRLTEVRRTALPTPYGHDLQPVAADDDRLWVTTGSQVYQYSYERNAFLQDFPAADVNQVGVKSVGDERASGQVLASIVQVGNICTWCTDTVSLFASDDAFLLHGAQIYKARWWVDPTTD
jgi:hypothetical protein